MQHLFSLGFSQHYLGQLEPDELDGLFDPTASAVLTPARVRFVAHGRARLLWPGLDPDADPPLALLTGPLRDPDDPVLVGDWLVVDRSSDPPLALRRLDRHSVLRRKDPGGGVQPVVANLDIGMICTALGHDLSLRRIERWLAICGEAGVDPVVVLTKADEGVDAAPMVQAASKLTTGPVVAVSALDGVGIDTLREHLPPGRTAALLGSSGVGKSTLLNRLLGEERQETRAVRSTDDKGRHTTTSRELFALPGGAWIIDNPGVRSVGLVHTDGVDGVFPEILALAGNCRYRDCAHQGEPGCAVQEALDRGELSADRHAAWQQLQREAAWEERRNDPVAAREARERWKAIHKSARRWRQLKEGEGR